MDFHLDIVDDSIQPAYVNVIVEEPGNRETLVASFPIVGDTNQVLSKEDI